MRVLTVKEYVENVFDRRVNHALADGYTIEKFTNKKASGTIWFIAILVKEDDD